MSLIEWDEAKFSVSHSRMDEQHENWVLMINTLHDSLLKKGEYVSAEDVIEQMLGYTKQHFAEEERLMRDTDYPRYEGHKRIHDVFVSQVEGLRDQAKAGDIILRSQVMSFLVRWFEDHILDHDKRYAEYVKDCA